MDVGYVAVAVVTMVANGAVAIADFCKAKVVVANSDAVGVPRSWMPLLGTLKAAGALGLLLGLLGVPMVGTAAAGGLVLFFTGALIAHLRARVLYNLYFPGVFWLLAIASLALGIAR